MAKSPEVNGKSAKKRPKQEEFSVTFPEIDELEHAVFTAEIRLIMIYFHDVLKEMYGEKGGAK